MPFKAKQKWFSTSRPADGQILQLGCVLMPLFFHFFTMAEICMLGRKYRKCSFVGSTFQPEHKIIVPKCLLASVT